MQSAYQGGFLGFGDSDRGPLKPFSVQTFTFVLGLFSIYPLALIYRNLIWGQASFEDYTRMYKKAFIETSKDKNVTKYILCVDWSQFVLLLFWSDNIAPDRLHNNSMGPYKDFIGNKVPSTYFLHIPDGLPSVWILFDQWRIHRMGTFFCRALLSSVYLHKGFDAGKTFINLVDLSS